jgi:hypothetical protein
VGYNKAVFVETTGFSEVREDFLPDPAYSRLQKELMADPDAGDVMPGCGSLRKLRISDAKRGKGKRGGARVIYLYVPQVSRFYMIDIYGKDEQDDLSQADRKAFRELAEAIKAAAVANNKEHKP